MHIWNWRKVLDVSVIAGVIILFGFIVLINGCTMQKIAPVAYDCPQIELPPEPIPATRKLTNKSKPNEIIKAWVATAKSYHDWMTIVQIEVETSK